MSYKIVVKLSFQCKNYIMIDSERLLQIYRVRIRNEDIS